LYQVIERAAFDNGLLNVKRKKGRDRQFAEFMMVHFVVYDDRPGTFAKLPEPLGEPGALARATHEFQ
jgi:hypothetical protein